MRQVRAAQIVVHARASALRINIGSAASRNNIVNVHSTKIDAESGAARGVGHARMHLRTGKKQQASRRGNNADLRVPPPGFPRAKLFSGGLFLKMCWIFAGGAGPILLVFSGR